MDTPPPPPPAPSDSVYEEPQGGGGDATGRLKIPAIILLVMACFGFMWNVYSVTTGGNPEAMVEAFNDPAFDDIFQSAEQKEQIVNLITMMTGRGLAILNLLLAGLVAFGAWNMLNGKKWGLSLTAAIIAIIPCLGTCCCLIEMPIGVWALIVLLNSEVKQSFT